MAENKRERFEQAKAAREQRRQQEESRFSGGGGNYEEIAYTGLVPGQHKVVRVVGNPMDDIDKQPTDPRRFLRSMIVDDSDKRMVVNWPMKDDRPDWIMWRVYGLVMSFDWVQDGDRNKRVYKYEESHPSIFNRVNKNGDPKNKFERGWTPTLFVAMNVIDRHDPEWHEENKHTKMLSKKVREHEGRFFYDPGIPQMLYDMIWDEIVEYHGPWDEYDIVLEKLKSSDAPWYRVMHAEHDLIKVQENVKPYIVSGPLTEEEREYEMYDFDKLFPVTSYKKLNDRLQKTFANVDAVFNTHYAEELADLAADEAKEQKESKPKDNSHKFEDTPDEELEEDSSKTPSEDSKEQEKSTPAPPRQRRRKASTEEEEKNEIPWDKLADGTYNGTKYLGVPNMTDDEKAMVVKVNDDGSFQYVDEWKGEKVKIYEWIDAEGRAFESPEQFNYDPLSGESFAD